LFFRITHHVDVLEYRQVRKLIDVQNSMQRYVGLTEVTPTSQQKVKNHCIK